MAENVQTLGEDLTCPICVEVFTEPVLLPCQHSFCRECLDTYVRKSDSQEKDGEAVIQDSKVINCPVCRSRTDLGVKGVKGLPLQLTLASIFYKYRGQVWVDEKIPGCSVCEDEDKNAAVNFCVTCSMFYCQDCVTVVHPMKGAFKQHDLITADDYLNRQKVTVTKGTTEDIGDVSDHCDDHGLEIIVFCGSCQRLLCKNCFEAHDGHCLKALSVIYGQNMKQTEEEITTLNEVKDDMEKMVTDLTRFEAEVEKKSLHIAEIEKAYQKIIESAAEWRKDCLKAVEDRHEEWRLACVGVKKALELKIEEATSLFRFSNEQLHGSKLRAIKGHDELMRRLVNLSTSAKCELQRHKDMSSKCRDDMDRDVVIPRTLYFREETISTPRLRFTEKLSDRVLIKDDGTVLVNVIQEGWQFNGALTDGRLLRGSHYWELDLSFNVKKTQGYNRQVYSAGVVRKGSDYGRYVGWGNLSWGVSVTYRYDQYKFGCWHNNTRMSTPVPVYPESASKKGVVRQGFYLNCEERTLTIIDVTNNRVLYIHRDLDLSEPLTPAVSVHNYHNEDVSVRIIPCNLSGLIKVLHDNMK